MLGVILVLNVFHFHYCHKFDPTTCLASVVENVELRRNKGREAKSFLLINYFIK